MQMSFSLKYSPSLVQALQEVHVFCQWNKIIKDVHILVRIKLKSLGLFGGREGYVATSKATKTHYLEDTHMQQTPPNDTLTGSHKST